MSEQNSTLTTEYGGETIERKIITWELMCIKQEKDNFVKV